MRKLLAVLSSISLLGATVCAQTLQQYLNLRKQHKISQAVGVAALETLVGSRVMEIKGTVRGSFTINGVTVLLVERVDGGDMEVESAKPVEWLHGNAVPARLLVKASRASEEAELRASLIGAAMEADIARIEAAAMKTATKAPVKPPVVRGGNTSRSKPAVQWNLPASQALPVYANFIRGYNKRLTQRQAEEIATGIIGFSIRYGVDARLIMAMVLVESGFNPEAKSYAGAMGLGQLMPGTANGMGITNAYDTYQNLYGTVRVIRGHIERYTKKTGDGFEGLILALAAYNAGSGNVRKHGGVPPFKQTQNYIRKVIAAYRQFSGQ
jgi:soluble lytic murein transglycosylase-like protein